VKDKEAIIRVQAVVGLSKLAGSEDPADLDDDEISIIETLVLILRHDTSP
jgi:condensin complex subunit 3